MKTLTILLALVLAAPAHADRASYREVMAQSSPEVREARSTIGLLLIGGLIGAGLMKGRRGGR